MKFINTTSKHLANLYGYDFPAGIPVEVKEDHLCRKFAGYSFLEEVKPPAPKKKAAPKKKLSLKRKRDGDEG